MLKINTKASIAAVEAAAAAEKAAAKFRADRAAAVEAAIVTVNGNQYNANERSIQRMTSAILAAGSRPDSFELSWSMADTDPGVMTSITLGELRQALEAATQNMAALWAR